MAAVSVAQAVLWPVPGAQADIFGVWWAPVGADVAPSPQVPARAPCRGPSGRLSGSAGVVTPAEVSRVALGDILGAASD